MKAKTYFSAGQLQAVEEDKTLYLQCQWRGYVARKLAWKLREEKEAAKIEKVETIRKQREEEEKKHKVSATCLHSFTTIVPVS